MDNTETDDDMIMVFSIDETASLLLEQDLEKLYASSLSQIDLL